VSQISPDKKPIGLTIVVPAHNEAGRISPMLNSYIEHFRNRAKILVVINGSSDTTQEVVETIVQEQLAGKFVGFTNIKEPVGKAEAVYRGFTEASTEYVGFVDADGSTPSFEFERLFLAIENFDGVIASRRLATSHVVNRSAVRRFISWSFSVLTNRYVRLGYRDTQCGAKIFKTDAVQKVLSQLKIRNSAFDVELLAALRQAGYSVHEEPTLWIDNSSSTMFSSPWKLFSSSWNMFRTLALLSKRYNI
jgi:dolichol-phosphate mannosyltransferase